MPDFNLIPGRTVQEYEIQGDILFRHHDEDHVAADLYVESDYHYPNQYAIQIVTTTNKTFIFDANASGTWPPVAQRLFERHQKMRKP